MECPRPIQSCLCRVCHVVVANEALHEDTKVRGPGVEAKHSIRVKFHFDL